MILVGAVEHSHFFGAFVPFSTLIDEVLLDQLLELLEKEHALGIGDWEGAEGIESWVLRVSVPLGLGRDYRHEVSLLAWQIQILEDLALTVRDLLDALCLFLDQGERQGLLDLQSFVVLFVNLKTTVVT